MYSGNTAVVPHPTYVGLAYLHGCKVLILFLDPTAVLGWYSSTLWGAQIGEGRVAEDARLLSTLAWSLAIFGAFDSPVYDGAMHRLRAWRARDFDPGSLRRLYQVCASTSSPRSPLHASS